MANLSNILNQNFINDILPVYGNPRTKVPTWDTAQKMFICDEYESETGNYYYRGIRFCDRIVIVEKVGLYHNWTYIDGIELYAFNGRKLELIQKKDYEKQFRKEEFVKKESEEMVKNYLTATLKMHGLSVPEKQVEENAQSLMGNCYKSFLDSDYNAQLMQILPSITPNKQLAQ